MSAGFRFLVPFILASTAWVFAPSHMCGLTSPILAWGFYVGCAIGVPWCAVRARGRGAQLVLMGTSPFIALFAALVYMEVIHLEVWPGWLVHGATRPASAEHQSP